VVATTAATINQHQGNNSNWHPHTHTHKTFETKQSTIGDNSCNNPSAATEKSSGNYWQQ